MEWTCANTDGHSLPKEFRSAKEIRPKASISSMHPSSPDKGLNIRLQKEFMGVTWQQHFVIFDDNHNSFNEEFINDVVEHVSTSVHDGQKVVLKVAKEANKIQIRQAIESAFDVKVESVNTVNVRPKKKRVGRYTGATKAYKKAIITLAEGSKLDLS